MSSKRSFLSLLVAVPAYAQGAGTIDGIITDTALVPMRGVSVSILQTNVRIETNSSGRFRIEHLPAGHYVFIARRLGYRPASEVLQVNSGDTLRVSYMLNASATMLAGVTVAEQRVSMRMLDFELRKRTGEGEFMDREQIERRNATHVGDLLRNFLSVTIKSDTGGSVSIRSDTAGTVGTRGGGLGSISLKSGTGGMGLGSYAYSRREGVNPLVSNACPLTVYLDDIRLPTPSDLSFLPSPRDLAGIEVYPGTATIPARYRGIGSECGVRSYLDKGRRRIISGCPHHHRTLVWCVCCLGVKGAMLAME